MKYILVSGGVISGIGKGTVCSSIGAILKSRGYNITHIKIDPYLNYNAGMMSPSEHGEVYVLNDGSEVDLDFGNYERFTGIELNSKHAITTGNILYNIITKEMKGGFNGKTLQMNPHIIEEIITRIEAVAEEDIVDINNPKIKKKPDFIIIELGGTVGEYESSIFTEAFSVLQYKVGRENCAFISVEHLIELPNGEQKSKPIQVASRNMKSFGIEQNIIICRVQNPIHEEVLKKLSLNCGIKRENIFYLPNLSSVYKVPSFLCEQGIFNALRNILNFKEKKGKLDLVEKIDHLSKTHKDTITIGIISKYSNSSDNYTSVLNAINFSSSKIGVNIILKWIDAEDLEHKYEENIVNLEGCDGILVPGGFGVRGIEGKIKAIQYARENKVPFFGICLGMQLSIIEICRNILNMKQATSEEFDEESEHKVISFITENGQKKKNLRVGRKNIVIDNSSFMKTVYSNLNINERHRHRFEVNREYIDIINNSGLKCVGKGADDDVPEIFELEDHPFFVGVQFHPEFNANPISPHPIFTSFISAAYKKINQ